MYIRGLLHIMNNLGSRRLVWGARHRQAKTNACPDKLPIKQPDNHLDNSRCAREPQSVRRAFYLHSVGL